MQRGEAREGLSIKHMTVLRSGFTVMYYCMYLMYVPAGAERIRR